MDDFLATISSILNNLLREINETASELAASIRPAVHEGRELAAALVSQATFETMSHNLRINLYQIYRQLVIIPRENNFYIPLITNSIKQVRTSMYTWNSSHLVAGSIGLFLGGILTTLLNRYVFPCTRFLTQMRAVVAKNGRGLQGISFVEEISVPIVTGSNDVLVHVKAAALDMIDLEIANGRGRILRELFQTTHLKKKNCYPIILGRDCTGTIVDIGRNVTRFETGDEVWLSVPYWMTGTMAEYISIKECYVSHKPERLDFFDAASLPYSGCIALHCVRQRAGIVDTKSGKGKRVLVHCGNTATGCIIIQLCAMYNVSITTSCVSNAVNKMIDAGAQNILLLDNISPEGSSTRRYDIVFNTIGETAHEFCQNHVVDGGSVIDASAMNYVPSDVSGFLYSGLYAMWLKLLQTFGYNLWKDVPMSAAILDELSELVNEGKLYPVTDSVFNVKYCERAFWFLQAAKVVGKPVIYFNVPGDSEFFK